MNEKIRILSCILVILWMIIVFSFSHQEAVQSSGTSQKVIEVILNVLPVEDNMNDNQKQQLISQLQLPIRKLAHFTIYFIGGMLIYLLFSTTKYATKTKAILSQVVATTYAISDELHQYFIPGRAMQFTDVCIDSAGALLGIIIAVLIIYILKNRKKKER